MFRHFVVLHKEHLAAVDSKFDFRAVVRIDSEEPSENLLEKVFFLTNSIDSNWVDNPEVLTSAFSRMRSTSVGDRILCCDTTAMYEVRDFGFELLFSNM